MQKSFIHDNHTETKPKPHEKHTQKHTLVNCKSISYGEKNTNAPGVVSFLVRFSTVNLYRSDLLYIYWGELVCTNETTHEIFVFIVFFSHVGIYVSNFYNDFFSVCFVWFRLVFRVIFIGGSIENIVCNLCLFQALFIYAMF